MSVRHPAVAGMFYPADPDELRRAVRRAFADAVPPPDTATVPKALIVPHAGYPYSGAVAASAYLRLLPARDTIHKVVLLGPSHRVHLHGLAAPVDNLFDTPLGMVLVDADLRAAIRRLPGVILDDLPHLHEHSLEVQLPFLQTVLDEFTLLPLSVGDTTTAQVAAVLEAVWGGPETIVVISTDLSHYHRYDEARRLDAHTAAEIVARNAAAIGDLDACGSRPLRGMLQVAAQRDLAVEKIDLRNSGDTAGDRFRVVGYGAFAIA
jgi:AmmeMemoRadiSam system protein B